MDKVYQSLLEDGINPSLGIGIYLDNPKTKDANDLRSEVGSIIELNDIEKLDQSGEKYKIKTIGMSNNAVINFPYKNMFSFMLGPIKVYPILEEYLNKKGIEWTEEMSAIEIYDQENEIISYMVVIGEAIPQDILEVARNNKDCSMAGILSNRINHNEITKTWWVDLDRMPELENDGCNPACVVNEESKVAEVNYRCTGLVIPTE